MEQRSRQGEPEKTRSVGRSFPDSDKHLCWVAGRSSVSSFKQLSGNNPDVFTTGLNGDTKPTTGAHNIYQNNLQITNNLNSNRLQLIHDIKLLSLAVFSGSGSCIMPNLIQLKASQTTPE